MELAGVSMGRCSELYCSSSEPHRTGADVAPPEISVTKSRTDCDFTHQMIVGISASSSFVRIPILQHFTVPPTPSTHVLRVF